MLEHSLDPAATEVSAWINGVHEALDRRNRLLHADPIIPMWDADDDPPVEGVLGLLNRRKHDDLYLTEITATHLRALAANLSRVITDWERIYPLALAVGTEARRAGR